MTKPVRKAVIPAAGLGTRFLPATKAMPKEMLPIVDKPTIQFIVEEAIASGIEDILIITGKSKRAIEDYFDSNYELEAYLEEKEEEALLESVKKIDGVQLFFIRQPYPRGLGHAVLQAKGFVGNEPFAVLLGDDLMESPVPLTQQLINVYEETGASNIAVMPVPHEHTDRYGVIGIEEEMRDGLYQVNEFVEKPDPDVAPSNLAIIGRYLLTPEVFDYLETQEPGAGNEIQLTDAIDRLNGEQPIYGTRFDGDRFDVGNKLGFLEFSIHRGLQSEEIGDDLKNLIIDLGQQFKKD